MQLYSEGTGYCFQCFRVSFAHYLFFLSKSGNHSDPDFPALNFLASARLMIHALQMNVITL